MPEYPVDPLTEHWTPLQIDVLEGLQAWTVGSAELNHHLARWTGLPTSDADALGHVVWAAEGGSPLTPRELSRRIGMTSGATTILLDRLAAAGMLARSREHADRRRVTLRPTELGRERTRAFTAFAGAEIAAAVRAVPAADLEVITGFLARMRSALDAANARLDERSTRSPAPHGGPDGC